ncbi:hypothetical protein ASE06_05950 [Sphingopyxis sp. Root214]|uniref:AraC family transcriptional regulator n=1 Tax=unclassified Sphingopyxis TaxID=2614943 RepID=UPI0006F87488|nr:MULTISPECIES: helix-turn-helix transcriptional regulator [unclassified Sphingopyxis]KQZ76708.1 hypothetical protein ASD73_02045 [Sphingopyxis sp. Root154]KRC09405.1 hypothetical protein ASE06_05950 [Sphingopyxis sp. Root214]
MLADTTGRSSKSVVLKTDDVEELQSVISANLRPAGIAARENGKRNFLFLQQSLDNVDICILQGDGAIDISLNSDPQPVSGYIFWMQLQGFCEFTFKGERYTHAPPSACFAGNNVRGTIHNGPRSRHLLLRFDCELVQRMWTEYGLPLAELDSGGLVILPSLIGSALQNYVHFVAGEMKQVSSLIHGPRAAKETEQLLITFLMQTIKGRHRPDLADRRPDEPAYLGEVEHLISQRLTTGVDIADLAERAGVSVRTFYRDFQMHKGCSPMEFFRTKQLEHAHFRLLESSPRQNSVTEVAYDLGFYHLSNFAALYKRKFGCLPSATLKMKG